MRENSKMKENEYAEEEESFFLKTCRITFVIVYCFLLLLAIIVLVIPWLICLFFSGIYRYEYGYGRGPEDEE